MPIPIDERKKPADVKVHVSTGAGVDIEWSDGHRSHFDFAYLRDNCPCATCDDERNKKAAAPTGMGPGLPMFKPKPGARAAHAMGHYALQIDFTDGHATGIYSYTYLREICPCADCEKEFRQGRTKEQVRQ
ncbi:MAG: DUF971 domain-containing protein [Acidobacteria bacterium]|nr:DUF971 domain-containing protein [Acidobacteriota bacterium]